MFRFKKKHLRKLYHLPGHGDPFASLAENPVAPGNTRAGNFRFVGYQSLRCVIGGYIKATSSVNVVMANPLRL